MAHNRIQALGRLLGIGLTWGVLWLAFWLAVAVTISILDPDSIDPGEDIMFLVIFGPMGFFSRVALGILLWIEGAGRHVVDRPVVRVAGWGVLATAIVQMAYLGHGDAGLAANLKMALFFSVIGGAITVVWLLIARRWWR